MPDRVAWAELRARIEALTGPVIHAQPIGTGHNSEVALAVHGPDCTLFLKGVRDGHLRAVRTQAAEAGINPVVAPVTARLAFHVREQAGTSSASSSWSATGLARSTFSMHRYRSLL